ncbi:hypothetical protein CAOG_05529 [Capsaspora owczarzaki ATCC 30864]|uniref:SUZ domain-containing protein n=1 Tax=Capsaspora owczarzaki (strain ATCC 30864) TaxID=595528 RepID=A0A0D2X3W1_CAPO3|nr:hypothetical protein CAOG_05529 [Capsaspora owczarzaki ATCC 30864]KJE94999.1 hypothetical protein CAOG_005529 [Capsaspora owczarzaki ATCC 30864]|eukprot:XP_004346202.1 hypothetical protein CAOG_05529 [Capsaspora owczarzaki ATCC 30864]
MQSQPTANGLGGQLPAFPSDASPTTGAAPSTATPATDASSSTHPNTTRAAQAMQLAPQPGSLLAAAAAAGFHGFGATYALPAQPIPLDSGPSLVPAGFTTLEALAAAGLPGSTMPTTTTATMPLAGNPLQGDYSFVTSYDPVLLEALNKSRKDHLFLAQIEERLVEWMRAPPSPQSNSLRLDVARMSSYHRKLVHQTAVQFGITDRRVEDTTMVLTRDAHSHLPEHTFQEVFSAQLWLRQQQQQQQQQWQTPTFPMHMAPQHMLPQQQFHPSQQPHPQLWQHSTMPLHQQFQPPRPQSLSPYQQAHQPSQPLQSTLGLGARPQHGAVQDGTPSSAPVDESSLPGDAEATPTAAPVPAVGSFKIMRRDRSAAASGSGPSTGSSPVDSSKKERRAMTPEERTAEYERARARIFEQSKAADASSAAATSAVDETQPTTAATGASGQQVAATTTTTTTTGTARPVFSYAQAARGPVVNPPPATDAARTEAAPKESMAAQVINQLRTEAEQDEEAGGDDVFRRPPISQNRGLFDPNAPSSHSNRSFHYQQQQQQLLDQYQQAFDPRYGQPPSGRPMAPTASAGLLGDAPPLNPYFHPSAAASGYANFQYQQQPHPALYAASANYASTYRPQAPAHFQGQHSTMPLQPVQLPPGFHYVSSPPQSQPPHSSSRGTPPHQP